MTVSVGCKKSSCVLFAIYIFCNCTTQLTPEFMFLNCSDTEPLIPARSAWVASAIHKCWLCITAFPVLCLLSTDFVSSLLHRNHCHLTSATSPALLTEIYLCHCGMLCDRISLHGLFPVCKRWHPLCPNSIQAAASSAQTTMSSSLYSDFGVFECKQPYPKVAFVSHFSGKISPLPR